MRIRGLVLMAALCAGCLDGSAGDTPSAGGDPHLGVMATLPAEVDGELAAEPRHVSVPHRHLPPRSYQHSRARSLA